MFWYALVGAVAFWLTIEVIIMGIRESRIVNQSDIVKATDYKERSHEMDY